MIPLLTTRDGYEGIARRVIEGFNEGRENVLVHIRDLEWGMALAYTHNLIAPQLDDACVPIGRMEIDVVDIPNPNKGSCNSTISVVEMSYTFPQHQSLQRSP